LSASRTSAEHLSSTPQRPVAFLESRDVLLRRLETSTPPNSLERGSHPVVNGAEFLCGPLRFLTLLQGKNVVNNLSANNFGLTSWKPHIESLPVELSLRTVEANGKLIDDPLLRINAMGAR
jgi:hypothetical protein